jgi:hypothetical protein
LTLAVASKSVAIRGQENALAHRPRQRIAQPAKRNCSGKAEKNASSPRQPIGRHPRTTRTHLLVALGNGFPEPAKPGCSGKAEKNTNSPPTAAERHRRLQQRQAPHATLGTRPKGKHNTDSPPASVGLQSRAQHRNG